MKIISFYNHKGGVAKTTSVINVAYYLQKQNKTVLIVDCDSQRNSFGFFFQKGKSDIFAPTKYENISLTTWEQISEQLTEQNNAEKSDIFDKFDYVLLDLPPAMTDEVKTMLRVSETVYVPTIIGGFEIDGLSDVTEEIRRQGTKLGGVFITMFQKDNDEKELADFQEMLGGRLLKTVIPYSKTVRESQKEGLSIEEYFDMKNVPKSQTSRKAAYAYMTLCAEIVGKN
jgi:chromosome partitioning protein